MIERKNLSRTLQPTQLQQHLLANEPTPDHYTHGTGVACSSLNQNSLQFLQRDPDGLMIVCDIDVQH